MRAHCPAMDKRQRGGREGERERERERDFKMFVSRVHNTQALASVKGFNRSG